MCIYIYIWLILNIQKCTDGKFTWKTLIISVKKKKPLELFKIHLHDTFAYLNFHLISIIAAFLLQTILFMAKCFVSALKKGRKIVEEMKNFLLVRVGKRRMTTAHE